MWQDFELAFRFTDPKYSVLESDELKKIRPIPPTASERSWHELFADSHHLLLRTPTTIVPLDRAWISTNEEAAEKLAEWNPAWLSSECVFFWSPSCAVVTDMQLVLSRFDDFCYGGDENVVILFPNGSRIVTWCDEYCLLEFVPATKVAAAWKLATL